MVQLDSFLHINHDTGLPDTFVRLEWHMETEPIKEQLSRADFYHLYFSGR